LKLRKEQNCFKVARTGFEKSRFESDAPKRKMGLSEVGNNQAFESFSQKLSGLVK